MNLKTTIEEQVFMASGFKYTLYTIEGLLIIKKKNISFIINCLPIRRINININDTVFIL